VPPGNPQALAAAMEEMVNLPAEARRQMGEAARRRMEAEFSLPAVAGAYAALYEGLVR